MKFRAARFRDGLAKEQRAALSEFYQSKARCLRAQRADDGEAFFEPEPVNRQPFIGDVVVQ